MIKKDRGITLTEVLVSLVVLGIVFATAFSILSITNNLTISNECKSNTFFEVESILEIFSSDPVNFDTNVKNIYQIDDQNISTDANTKSYRIYYSSAFLKKDNQKETSQYYLDITYKTEEIDGKDLNKYTVQIVIYHKDTQYKLDGNDMFSLEIVK